MSKWMVLVAGAIVSASLLVIDGWVFDVLAKGGGGHKGGYSGDSHSKGGDTSVRGYTRKDGTYVQPHKQTAPNSSKLDNYSTKGNVNPYTGKEGTVDPFQR